MTIKTKVTKSGISYHLGNGVTGTGRECWVVQVEKPGKGCVHQDTFSSLAEAESWFKFACN
jgi:hypothetical protein